MNGCHSDDVGFVGLWHLYCNYLLTRIVFPPHTSTPINMFTGCYDPGSDFSARLLTGYDYGTPQVSSHISHGQSSQSAE